MIRLPRPVISTAVSVLAIGALAAPVAAADPEVTIGHGIPGVRADICANGVEIKSAMRYGRSIVRTLAPGEYTLEVFKQDPRTCRGIRLLQQDVSLAADADLTVVATKKAPKLVVFDNSWASCTNMAVRHAADVGDALLSWRTWGFFSPTAPPVFQKGEQWGHSWWGCYYYDILSRWVAFDASGQLLARSDRQLLLEGRRYEAILVGTTRRNARFIHIDRENPVVPAP